LRKGGIIVISIIAITIVSDNSCSSVIVGECRPRDHDRPCSEIDAAVVAARLGLSRPQVWRTVKEGRFPKPWRRSTGAVAWLEVEVSVISAPRTVG
jgi:predicted DNA-binding transcriptional regulator AlpA